MSLRVRCTKCQTAFLAPGDEPGTTIECPKCGAPHRLPEPHGSQTPSQPPVAVSELSEAGTVFVPSNESRGRTSRRRWMIALSSLAILLAGGVTALVLRPWYRPRSTDPVERVAESYLDALIKGDAVSQRTLSTIDEPPAIRSYQKILRDHARDHVAKGSFATLAALHGRIDAQYSYDQTIGRFTPKNPLGPAGEALDTLHQAKENAQKPGGLYDKMARGRPDDLFDAAEGMAKLYANLAEGVLASKKLLPTYKMLVDEAKPPIGPGAKDLAANVADHAQAWQSLLKRPFHTLKADGPFIFEQAQVDAQVTDQLASLGDPPSTLRLELVRFRLEGIDTGWRVVEARRVLPGASEEPSFTQITRAGFSEASSPRPPPGKAVDTPTALDLGRP
ncbi:MAG: hypothetical protein ACLP7Q_21505 [Isosphaeraceae bacterium]